MFDELLLMCNHQRPFIAERLFHCGRLGFRGQCENWIKLVLLLLVGEMVKPCLLSRVCYGERVGLP